MRSIGLILCCAMLVWSAAAAAKPAYVQSTVNLRAAPNTTSDVLGKIPGGSLVDADNCTDGWCAVTWQEKRGFAIQTSLDLSGRVPQRRASAPPRSSDYVEERGPPVYYEGGEVPPPNYYYYGYGPYYRGGYYRPYYRSYYYGRYHRW
jgi:uncharacterized protein YraI